MTSRPFGSVYFSNAIVGTPAAVGGACGCGAAALSRTAAETVNRVCGSGLQAVVHAVEAVKAGFIDLILAGGTESMSNAPYLMTGARWGYRMGNGQVVDSMLNEGLTCSIHRCHMGITA